MHTKVQFATWLRRLVIGLLLIASGIATTGCVVYYSGFEPTVSPAWNFPVGSDSCRVFIDVEGGRDKAAYFDSTYLPEFSISDGGDPLTKDTVALSNVKIDSLQLRFREGSALSAMSLVSTGQRAYSNSTRHMFFERVTIPPQIDTVWLTLFLRAPQPDSLVPLVRTWELHRDDYKVRTILNE